MLSIAVRTALIATLADYAPRVLHDLHGLDLCMFFNFLCCRSFLSAQRGDSLLQTVTMLVATNAVDANLSL